MYKRKREPAAAAPPARDVEDEEDGSSGSSDEDEAMEEMLAAGLLGRGAGASSSSSAAHINNAAALRRAFADIRQDLPWIERLEVVSAEPLGVDNVNDDLKLELAFYGQALAAVSAARSEFDRLKIPHRRPDDYFAEMLKTDTHMANVKAKLLAEQGRMQAAEGRRAAKESAAFHKQAEAEKAKVKAGEKRASMDALKQWRKHKGDARPELSSDKDLDALFKGSGSGTVQGGGRGAGGGGDKFHPGKSAKRKFKDRKFGHGGPKHFSKENTSKSSSSMKGFSVKGMKARPLAPGMKPRQGAGKKKSSAKGADRPGKWARSSGKGGRK